MMSLIKKTKGIFRCKHTVVKNVYTKEELQLHSELFGVITVDERTIGKAIVRRIKRSGGHIVVAGRNKTLLNEWASDLNCPSLFIDDYSEVLECSEKLLGHPINCLINNASASLHQSSITTVNERDFIEQFEVNCKDAYFLEKEFVKYLSMKGIFGNILNISTTKSVEPDDLPYGALKSVINTTTKGVANKYSSILRCNSLLLGPISTIGDNSSDIVDMEIAEVASFILSNLSSCINGQLIECDNNIIVR